MAKVNRKPQSIKTEEGAPAKRINADLQLRRSIMACLLWEDNFYESGESISDRIVDLCKHVSNDTIAEYAMEARSVYNLRHVPLWLAVQLARKRYDKTAQVIESVVQRADEMAELLALYWKDGRVPIAAQVKKGLARSFVKFNEYQLAKYNRDGAVKLRDVLFLSHAKPKSKDQAELWKRLVNNELATPDTWEVNLSAGKDKRETWERLITQKKLGALAFLRNLRNMQAVNVRPAIIREGLESLIVDRVLPFRFVAAEKYAPSYADSLERLMFRSIGGRKLPGVTVLLVDVSGSMDGPLSSKSDMDRIDAACGLAMILREMCEVVYVYTFSNECVMVPNRRGFALASAIKRSQGHGGTYLGRALKFIRVNEEVARTIVMTDEQSHDRVPDPKGLGYMINVATNRNGVGYGAWVHVDGFSEAIVNYIMEYEGSCQK